jgi:hypothetical protein
MKMRLINLTSTLPLCLYVGLAFSARATITGQWDFKTNYSATIGQAIVPQDSTTAAGTLFESTTSFGISSIDGVATNVMFFPKATDDNAGFDYEVPVGAAPNDTNNGGYFVNQYTVIMDVLLTNLPAEGKTFTLFGTDNSFLNGSTAGEFFVTPGGEVGWSGGSGGSLTTNVWHRIAIAVDTDNTNAGLQIFIDGTNVVSQGQPSAINGIFSISSDIYLFDDAKTNSGAGYIASLQFDDVMLPNGIIAELGSPVASGILTGPAPSPYIISEAPLNDLEIPALSTIPPTPLITIVLHDGVNTVNDSTIVLKLNGSTVPATVNYSAPTTTITYQVTNLLAPGSLNTVLLSYQDTGANNLGVEYSFDVGPYIPLPIAAAGAPGSASVPGFIYRVAQGTIANSVDSSYESAQALLDGTLLNSSGVPYTNEANLSGTGFQTDSNGEFAGTWFVDQYETNNGIIAFSTLNPPQLDGGNGGTNSVFPGFTGLYGTNLVTISTNFFYSFPGIPGQEVTNVVTNGETVYTTNSNSDNFADDVLAYIPLTGGVSYTFGVGVWGNRIDTPPDNGYELLCGPNPRDFFSTVVGQYVRTTVGSTFNVGINTNTFTFAAPVTGVYPFRLIHWAPAPASGGNSDGMLAWYYVDPVTGSNVPINQVGGAVSAFRVSTILREPYVAEVAPAPGGEGFASTAPIVVVLSDDQLQVGSGSVKLYLNGNLVTPTIGKTNTLTTVTYNPDALRTTLTNDVELVYSDNATNTKSFTNNWSFTIVAPGATTPPVTGQWDFNGNLDATVGSNLLFFDGPSGYSEQHMTFGTCSSFGIQLINGSDAQVMFIPGFASQALDTANDTNYGLKMFHGIAPNGGGRLVNQYTIIYDMYWQTISADYDNDVLPFFQCQNTNNASGTDGSLFLQGGEMGQGSGGYTMNHGSVSQTNWHRIAFAVDLAAGLTSTGQPGGTDGLITKWVDGVKAQDWISSANDVDLPRRAWQPEVSLFSDCDTDDHGADCYVSSIQVRSGKLSDADMVLLGGPSAGKIPQTIPATSVTGQWDFNFTTTLPTSTSFDALAASVGSNLLFFDGTSGYSSSQIVFSNCAYFGIPDINGVNAQVMFIPGFASQALDVANDTNYGLKMFHLIAPNGGGRLVNQYTIIYDMCWQTVSADYNNDVLPFFQCQNTNNANGTDGSLFLQGGDMGQGSGGYTMNHGAVSQTNWHRLAFAVDLAAGLTSTGQPGGTDGLITKWVDGVKAQDWISSANDVDLPRRAWQPEVSLFSDCDGDDHGADCWVKSIQVSAGKLSDAQMMALGGPSAYGIPLAVPTLSAAVNVSGGTITFSWPTAFSGYVLSSTTNLGSPFTPVTGVDYTNNIYTVPISSSGQAAFFQLTGSTNLTAGGLGYEPGLP